MTPIFKNEAWVSYRLVLMLFCSVFLIYFDHKTDSFAFVRAFIQTAVNPLQYLASAPQQMLNWAAENIVTRQQLMEENRQYKINTLVFQEQSMQLEIVKRENDRLRSLLSSPLRSEAKKMVAEILAVDSDPYTYQLVINRGQNDGVYEGQAVIDDLGVVGQVLHVGQTNSRVLLITDVTHAVPVRIQRNGVRLIAQGNGIINSLTHNYVSHSTDIQEGDLLVTSGLGGKFPEGYPVSTVTRVIRNESRAFSQVTSKPVANIERLRYVLLLDSKQIQRPERFQSDNSNKKKNQ